MSGQYRMFYALRKPVSHFEFYAFHFTIKLSISLVLALLDYWISTFLFVSIYKCFYIHKYNFGGFFVLGNVCNILLSSKSVFYRILQYKCKY